MATAESVKAQLTALLNQANDTTGKTDETLTAAIASLAAGFGQGGGASGIYMAKITPAENLHGLTIQHNLGTTDILLVACWAETMGEIVPETSNTLAKFWAKTDIVTQRLGNGFSPGYSWNTTTQYASPVSPNAAAYETLQALDENNIYIPRSSSGNVTYYLAGLTYTVIVIAASAEV